MHMQTTTILCCALLLLGFATATQSNKLPSSKAHLQPNYSDNFDDIDDAEMGSGDDREMKHDLGEASGSGSGPDDDDEEEPDRSMPDITPPPPYPTTDKESRVKKPIETDFVFTQDNSINKEKEQQQNEKEIHTVFDPKSEIKPASFFAQPGILAAAIGGAIVGLLCAILVVMFIVYRMRKKDEGVYTLEETKRLPTGRK